MSQDGRPDLYDQQHNITQFTRLVQYDVSYNVNVDPLSACISFSILCRRSHKSRCMSQHDIDNVSNPFPDCQIIQCFQSPLQESCALWNLSNKRNVAMLQCMHRASGSARFTRINASVRTLYTPTHSKEHCPKTDGPGVAANAVRVLYMTLTQSTHHTTGSRNWILYLVVLML